MLTKPVYYVNLNPFSYIRGNEPLMLTARNAELAIKSMFTRAGQNLQIRNGEAFSQGYDNYTGGAANIANFNALCNPSGALYIKMFYGFVSWGIMNDNLGVTNHYVMSRYFHDQAGASYAFTLNYARTLDSAITFFSSEQGVTAPVFVNQCQLSSKSLISLDGYIFDISV